MHPLPLFFFWPRPLTFGILVPQPGVKPRPPAVKAWSPNHWTTREFPIYCLYIREWAVGESGLWAAIGIAGGGGISCDGDQVGVQNQYRLWVILESYSNSAWIVLKLKPELGRSWHFESQNWWVETLMCFSLMVVSWDHSMELAVKKRARGI